MHVQAIIKFLHTRCNRTISTLPVITAVTSLYTVITQANVHYISVCYIKYTALVRLCNMIMDKNIVY